MIKIFRISLLLLLVYFSGCNTGSGEGSDASQPQGIVNASEQDGKTSKVDETTSVVNIPTQENTPTATKSTVENNKVQGSGVPTPPDFGLGF